MVKGLEESRDKLAAYFDRLGFGVIYSIKRPNKRWTLLDRNSMVDGKPLEINVEIKAHRDGRCADYVICNEHWNPINV